MGALTAWLRRNLQRFIFAPDAGVKIAGISANALLLRADNGRPLIAIDRKGNVGVWGLRAGEVTDLSPRIRRQAQPNSEQSRSESAGELAQRVG